MKPFRRELINGLFVLVVGSLISTAFGAFQLKFDVRRIREHKRILCFEGEVIDNNHELKSGIIRVGQGPRLTLNSIFAV